VGLEKRENGRSYYYRYHWNCGKVRRQYVAAGELGCLIAGLDRLDRAIRELEREREQEKQKRLGVLFDSVVEACDAVDILSEAALVASGYRCHRGEWRKRRAG
jgi:hypothetical protein